MKTSIVFTAAALLSFSLGAADSSPKDDITNAAKKLADTPNYSWRTTVVVPDDSRFHPGPTEGKTEKDGFTSLNLSFGDNETKAVLKDNKGAATNPDGEWQSISEMANDEGPRRFMAMMLRNFKPPAAQVAQLVSFSSDLKKDGDTYSSDLTEDGAKTLLTFRPPAGGEGPSVSNAKGSVKFWLKDGALTKYEFKLKGTVSFNGNDFEQDRATTVQIKDVGVTNVSVPDEAKKKMS